MTSTAVMWIPQSPEMVQAQLQKVRDVAACNPQPPAYAAEQAQEAAAVAEALRSAGLVLTDPGQQFALLTGLLIAFGTAQANDGIQPLTETTAVTLASIMRITEGLTPPTMAVEA